MTRAAAANDAEACATIGRYWVEKSGWYPCNQHQVDEKSAREGISWVLLAAHLSEHDLGDMASRFAVAALVLLENGLSEEGRHWLRQGIRTLEASNSSNLRPLHQLQHLDKTWPKPTATAAKIWFDPLLPEQLRPALKARQTR
jgi:hypothetical protein